MNEDPVGAAAREALWLLLHLAGPPLLAMLACRGRSNFRPPPRHTPQAPTTYHPKANLVVRVWAA